MCCRQGHDTVQQQTALLENKSPYELITRQTITKNIGNYTKIYKRYLKIIMLRSIKIFEDNYIKIYKRCL